MESNHVLENRELKSDAHFYGNKIMYSKAIIQQSHSYLAHGLLHW